ncbi:MAG: hypothetical protein HYS43_00820 [Candidatus Liptonbacteria bacterium]|nr:hypothetical protein [Candidatus Liptonbacteria bacterium]
MNINTRNGQVMLLTVTVLSAGILGATSVAATLMLYQIRQANDILNSTQAIYAADAGIERGLYCANPATQPESMASCSSYNSADGWTLGNNAKVFIDPPPPYTGTVSILRTIGESNRVRRAFENVITPASRP